MKGNEFKGALLKRFAGEAEIAKSNNNHLATTPLNDSDVHEMQQTRVLSSSPLIKFL